MLALSLAAVLALPSPEQVLVTHVSVVNVLNGRIETNVAVLVTGGSITAIGKTVHAQKAKVVDGMGKFLIPGLWDMHVHCCNANDHFFPLFVANGITGIRDMGDPMDELKSCRTNVEHGKTLGPRMVFAGPMLDGPTPCWPAASIAVRTPDEGRNAVDKVQHDGSDFVKVYSLLSREAYFAIADEANKRHIPFAGHVPDEVTAMEASKAGQKCFEHLINVLEGCSTKEGKLLADHGSFARAKHNRMMFDSYDPAKAKALFACFRRNGTWQCPTLRVLEALARPDVPTFQNDPRISYLSADILSFWNSANEFGTKAVTAENAESGRLLFAKCCETVGAMAKSGVGILAGTDTPNRGAFPGFGLHDELSLMVKCGLNPLQALQTATINPARYFGWEQKMGTVQVGKVADLVLLDANPLENIHNTTKIAGVFVRGKYLDRVTLDQMLKH